MSKNSEYPRPLNERERDWLEWLLPEDRRGYRDYRSALEKFEVIGEGRRGKGNLVLGYPGDKPDLTSPLSPVFAYGLIEGVEGSISILAREEAGNQIEIEIVPLRGEAVPRSLTEKSRWTYSTWSPSRPCPCCGKTPREVPIGTPKTEAVLTVCPSDHRLWVYDVISGVNHLIPVTNFYNELMLVRQIRDPQIALHPSYLFSHLTDFSDEDLVHAFVVYNKIRKKVDSVTDHLVASRRDKSFKKFLKKYFTIK